MSLLVERWGKVHYEEANRRQLELVDAVAAGADERLIICTHPPVVTLGRASAPEDVVDWKGETYESARGGRATYHGPNQIVVYPILDLKRPRKGIPERDVHAYLRSLEKVSVMSLRASGLPDAEVRTTKVGELSLTGVWIGERKIASIGIAVRKWVTYHGVAVNVLADPSAFQGINPCGFRAGVMTSLEAEMGQSPNYAAVAEVFEREFFRMFV